VDVLEEAFYLVSDADSDVAAAVTAKADVHHAPVINAPYPRVGGVMDDQRHESDMDCALGVGNRLFHGDNAGKSRVYVTGRASQNQTPKRARKGHTLLSPATYALVKHGDLIGLLDQGAQRLHRQHGVYALCYLFVYRKDVTRSGFLRGL
jgi:hypothetical protein